MLAVFCPGRELDVAARQVRLGSDSSMSSTIHLVRRLPSQLLISLSKVSLRCSLKATIRKSGEEDDLRRFFNPLAAAFVVFGSDAI